mgnify:CR=1 FL=1
MIILDIDQDYFFLPSLSGEIIESPIEREKKMYLAECQTEDVIRKFGIKNFKSKVFSGNDHDFVYYTLKSSNVRNATLIHIDAHSDVEYKKELSKVNIGNWISHLAVEGIINKNIIWVNQTTEKPYTRKFTHKNVDYYLHTSRLNDLKFCNKIDAIFYTRSIEFCPPNSKEIEFYNNIGLRFYS